MFSRWQCSSWSQGNLSVSITSVTRLALATLRLEADSHTALRGPSCGGRADWVVWGLRAPRSQDSRLTGPHSLVLSAR